MKKIILLFSLVSCTQLEKDLATPTGQTIEHIAEEVIDVVVEKETGVQLNL